VLSFLCLLGSIGIIAQKYPNNISLSRNVDLISRDRVAMDEMKLWHYATDRSCGSNKDFEGQLLNAPWRSDTKKQFDGLVVEASVKVSEIELRFIAFSIYVFSTSFQFLRWWCFESFCDPENRPEFSRWLEYVHLPASGHTQSQKRARCEANFVRACATWLTEVLIYDHHRARLPSNRAPLLHLSDLCTCVS
jgi:hypothetical protein